MRVRDLIRGKPEVLFTAQPKDELSTAIHRLIKNNVGGLPVLGPDGDVVGFLSERDVVRAADEERKPLDALHVQDVMRPAPLCEADESIEEAMRRMTAQRQRHLVVRDRGKVVGVLSVGDMVKYRLEQLETEAGVLRDYVAAQRAAH